MKYLGEIADHTTPKITTGEASFTIASRDYKGPMVVVYETDNTSGTPPERFSVKD